jgi:hypothetical protein
LLLLPHNILTFLKIESAVVENAGNNISRFIHTSMYDFECQQETSTSCVFIITDKAKVSRGGGNRCRCYERRRLKA